MEIKTIDKVFYEALGKHINNARLQKGLSLRQMAKKTGKTFQMLDYYSLGKAKMSNETFESICRVLDLEPKFKVKIIFE